jgi:hypothetical protein
MRKNAARKNTTIRRVKIEDVPVKKVAQTDAGKIKGGQGGPKHNG